MKYGLVIYISIGLLFASFSIAFGAQGNSYDQSIRWAERSLAKASKIPSELYACCGTQLSLREAEFAFQDIINKYGKDNGRAWAGLARSEARLGQYGKAVKSYRQALNLLTGHTDLKEELNMVLKQRSVADSASTILPKGETVLQALPYPVPTEKNLWVVLSATKTWDKEFDRYWPEVSNCHLTVYKDTQNSLKQIWRSKQLKLAWANDSADDFNDAYLFVQDMTGDKIPELVTIEVIFGASVAPTHIDVFKWNKDKAAHILGAGADDSIVVTDINKDGRYEVIGNHAIGWGLSHAEQPRWLNTFAYKNGAYQNAEKDFPRVYDNLQKEIWKVLREAPDDFELRYYNGRIYEIKRKPQLAIREYRLAIKYAKEQIVWMKRQDSSWADLIVKTKYLLKQSQSRIKVLNGEVN